LPLLREWLFTFPAGGTLNDKPNPPEGKGGYSVRLEDLAKAHAKVYASPLLKIFGGYRQ
jgi:hypothetical protein